MNLKNKIILVTGANRGIGLALVEAALQRGAKLVYAGTRTPFTHLDPRVVSLTLDVTNAEQIRQAAEEIESLDILINNAGVAMYDDLSDRAMIMRHLAVNLFGMYDVTRAFLPALIRSHGTLVNNLSIAAVAALMPIASYSVSKAAAFSLTQSMRAFFARHGVKVQAVLTGPTDTDMTRDIEIPKASPEFTANGILDGIEREEEEIFPDPISASLAENWRNGPLKEMERQNAFFVTA